MESIIDPITGEVTNKLRGYIEVGSGLNYLADPATADWQPSEDLIELMPDGSAAALRGPAKLYAQANLNQGNSVTILTAANRSLSGHPIGIFWYDPLSGNASLVARLQDCVGELEPPNQIVYRGAFGELADLRLTYTRGAIESDLVLLQCPQLPPGFDRSTARLELWHQWEPLPSPSVTSRSVGASGAVDDILDFGDLWLPTGAAYWSDGSEARPASAPATVRVPTLEEIMTLAPVAKTWLALGSQDVLVEGIPWQDIAATMLALPPAATAAGTPPVKNRSAWIAELTTVTAPSSGPPVAIGAGPGYQPVGLVWDYIAVPSSCTTNYTFAAGTNYYISSSTYFSANVAFYPCVIQFNANAYLMTYGSISCYGSGSSPTLLTSWADLVFGQQVQTPPPSTPCPTYAAAEGLWDYYINANVTISGMRFRWANTALRLDANGSCAYTHQVSGCSFEFCQVGIFANNCDVTITTSTNCGVSTPTNAGSQCVHFSGSLTDTCAGDPGGITEITDYFGGPGTLAGHVVSQVSQRTGGFTSCPNEVCSSSNKYESIWNWSNPNDCSSNATLNISYNINCWLYGVTGLTAYSPWHAAIGAQTCHQGGPTMITARHAITQADKGSAWPSGMPVHFVDYTNNVYERHVLYGTSCAQDSRLWVVVLDTDLPASVGFMKVLPSNLMQKLPPSITQYWSPSSASCYFSQFVPGVGFESAENAWIFDVQPYSSGLSLMQPTQWFPNWHSWCYRNFAICAGCCSPPPVSEIGCGGGGPPACLLIKGELALLGYIDNCNQIGGFGPLVSDINCAIAACDTAVGYQTGYTVTLYDVNSFPNLSP